MYDLKDATQNGLNNFLTVIDEQTEDLFSAQSLPRQPGNKTFGASYDKQNGILVSTKILVSTALAHELVHSLRIGHSYSDRPVLYIIILFDDRKYKLFNLQDKSLRSCEARGI